MFQTYTPAESATIWMRFTPATAEKSRAPVDEQITNENEMAEDLRKKTAGVPISSVDTQSQLTKCEYQRDSIRVGKRLCSLSSLS